MTPVSVTAMIDKTIGVEGKYSNNSADRGGETMWGITEFTARAFGYKNEMRDMPRSVAVVIYRARFWIQPKFDQLAEIDQTLALRLFDIGVNMGQSAGVKFLQRALNVLNRNQADYPDIAVDGSLGKITLQALAAFLKLRSQQGHSVILEMVIAQQTTRYIEIAEKNASQERFEFGWVAQRSLMSAT